ncbi:MAG: GFA family protein [Pseudomonadota bacterium]|nr:GFA family protein [Pseudomonadota bacterium]
MRFVAQLPDPPVPALECNCSMCSITGYVHIIVSHDDFRLECGCEMLTSYRFGSGAAEHLFCSACGVKSFYQPRSHPAAWSINADCLDQRPELSVDFFDGRDWENAKAALDGE